MIGVMSTVGVDTATETSARLKVMSSVGVYMTLHLGSSISAAASALIMKSLTESLTPRASRLALSSVRSFSSASS
jgi:hypothetical protein